jgi:cytochrome c2
MKQIFYILFLVPLTAGAEPLVTGFERFHAAKPSAEGGRLLYNELGCANCHGGETGLPARRGPAIAGITQRINADWLRAYLTDPAKEKPGTNMPHLLAAGEVESVVHYLASIAPKAPFKPKAAKYLNAERGSDVFHTMGCVTCHAPGKDYQPPAGPPSEKDFTHRSVTLPDLAKKYSIGSMIVFLGDPLKFRPDGRMPHTEMHDSDVSDLAAHLLDFQHSDGTTAKPIQSFKADKALAAKGKAIVAKSQCAACHELPKEVAVKPLPLKALEDGCLSNDTTPGRPQYALSGTQREALKQYLSHREQPLNPKAQVALTLQALNCNACHSRDGLGGPDAPRKAYFTGDHSLGDTGMFPPGLSEVGRKLQPAWLKEVLSGKGRVRPYLQTKMPRFGSATDALPALLAKADAKTEKPLPVGQPEHGKKLLGILGGNGCITCHRWEKRPSLGIQALDLSTIAQRYQPGWLRDYLIDPAGSRPGTLMPSFWPKGVAANQTILGGDTDQQIAAILAFSQAGKDEPEGYPSTVAGEFELIPKDRPIIQRSFMEQGGTHAILVGFPAGIHLAYDGKAARPVMLWKGKFFDAYNTWFTRAAPFEKPLGDVIAQWPAASTALEDVHFRGYRLDAAGVPSFLYDYGKAKVEDRFEPKDGKLHRTLLWDAAALPEFPVSHPDDVTVTEETASPGHRHFIYSWK